MPIYEYRCTECGHELEALQRITDDPLVFCPECGAETLKKKISAAAFRLKGSGWYETDFKKADKQKNLAKDSGEERGDKDTGGKKDKEPVKTTEKETAGAAGDKAAASKPDSKPSTSANTAS